jgi:IclR family acetate operon transcriptional repressor
MPVSTSRRAGAESHLARGLRALEILAAGGRTAADVARELEVNRSTALRLLNELEGAGYVARDQSSKRYRIVAERVYALAASEEEPHDWTELIHPLLARVRDDVGESTILGVPANGSVVYMAFFPTDHPVSVRERIGTVRPMHASALGKAYLSALDDRSLALELERLSYQGGTALAAHGPDDLRRRLDEVRSSGYAIDRGETFDGVLCVAAPATVGGSVVGAVGVSGPGERLADDRVHAIGVRLVGELAAVARRIR